MSVSLLALLSGTGSAIADTCELPDPSKPYRLVFEDEFNGNQLDAGNWNREYLWGPGVVINNETQYYVNEGQHGYDPFSVRDGKVFIEANKTPFEFDELYLTRSIYSARSVELLWRTPFRAERYEVYRDGALIATVNGGSYFEPDLREGIDYTYEVVAIDGNGNPLVNGQLTVNTSERFIPNVEQAFTLGLKARVYGPTAGEVVWDSPNRAGSYEVYRDGALYRTLPSGTFASLYEAGLQQGRTYTYRVVSYDFCGEEIISDTVTLNTGDGVTPPDAGEPRLVIQLDEYSNSSAEISWNAVTGARRYDVYEDGFLVQSTDGRSLYLEGLVPDEARRYRVEALDGSGNLIDQTTRVVDTGDNSFALNRQPYVSGVMTSYNSFRFRYGRVEYRARMPKGQGLWTAFFLLPAYYNQDEPLDPEIDIVEAIGDIPTTLNQAYHYEADFDGDGIHSDYVSTELRGTIEDFSQAFHTYSVDWEPGRIIWYVDGVETNRLEGPEVSSEQMYLIANLAVGGDFPGPADETTPFPARTEIDYIRVYQRN